MSLRGINSCGMYSCPKKADFPYITCSWFGDTVPCIQSRLNRELLLSREDCTHIQQLLLRPYRRNEHFYALFKPKKKKTGVCKKNTIAHQIHLVGPSTLACTMVTLNVQTPLPNKTNPLFSPKLWGHEVMLNVDEFL